MWTPETANGRRFIIIAGGGKTARRYQDAAARSDWTNDDLDWIGLHATRLNGHLRTIFRDRYSPRSDKNPDILDVNPEEKWWLQLATATGCSTNHEQFRLPERVGTKNHNLSQYWSCLYSWSTHRPQRHKMKNISWAEFRLTDSSWIGPRILFPFWPNHAKLDELNWKYHQLTTNLRSSNRHILWWRFGLELRLGIVWRHEVKTGVGPRPRSIGYQLKYLSRDLLTSSINYTYKYQINTCKLAKTIINPLLTLDASRVGGCLSKSNQYYQLS